MTPKEGIETWCCGLILLKDAPHLDKAYDLIDSMISPETGEIYLKENGMGHSNMVAFQNVSDDVLASAGLPRDPDTLLTSGVMYCRLKNKEHVIDLFQTMQAGG
jgi:spermidine/putrescine transport system substrate-binding protein